MNRALCIVALLLAGAGCSRQPKAEGHVYAITGFVSGKPVRIYDERGGALDVDSIVDQIGWTAEEWERYILLPPRPKFSEPMPAKAIQMENAGGGGVADIQILPWRDGHWPRNAKALRKSLAYLEMYAATAPIEEPR